ncbi:MAG: hypothetical protein JXR21_02470, partial [Candidatus Marinimicrobia bacterium]|nr:hypothetical protein [Candidatus Neomarinimicrobiota bacterium]
MPNQSENPLITRILEASLRLARMKERNTLSTFTALRERARPVRPPRLMDGMFAISVKVFKGRNVWTISPKEERSEYHILYLHGGAYAVNFTPPHWFFI